MIGLNVRVTIYRMNSPLAADDNTGGAMTTGSVTYSDLPARIEDARDTLVYVGQGMEAPSTFNCFVRPNTLNIRHRDELVVNGPTTSPFVGQRMRIINVMSDSLTERGRSHLWLVLERIGYGRQLP